MVIFDDCGMIGLEEASDPKAV